MTVTTAGLFHATNSCVVWASVLPQAGAIAEETLSFHAGTTERNAKVIPLGVDEVSSGDSGGLLLRLDRAMATYAGQRFVLRRPGVHGQATVAGGEVLDPHPPRGKGSVSRAAQQLEHLRSDPKDRLLALARQARSSGVPQSDLVWRLPPGQGERAARALEKKGKLARTGGAQPRWIDPELLKALVGKVVMLVDQHHEDDPMSAGLPAAEIETRLPPPERHLASPLVEQAIAARKLKRDGNLLAVPGRGGSVDAEAAEQMDSIATLYEHAEFTPPFDADVTEELGIETKRLRDLLGMMRRQHRLERVAEGLHYASSTLESIQSRVVSALQDDTELTASELKEIAGGASRKWLIPLLEHLDRNKVTLRVGNVRKLHPSRRATS